VIDSGMISHDDSSPHNNQIQYNKNPKTKTSIQTTITSVIANNVKQNLALLLHNQHFPLEYSRSGKGERLHWNTLAVVRIPGGVSDGLLLHFVEGQILSEDVTCLGFGCLHNTGYMFLLQIANKSQTFFFHGLRPDSITKLLFRVLVAPLLPIWLLTYCDMNSRNVWSELAASDLDDIIDRS
jgi:hypothetical protein